MTAPADAQEINVVGTDFAFEPDGFTVDAGSPVVVTFENRGAVAHDWILRTDEGAEVAGTRMCAAPGETVVASFSLSGGTYEAWCSLPGHYESGMKGEVKAEPASAG
ncbi:MAG: cupredoxin domain-containing protein [Actinobacteria bacterium]|nr:cupredoxin domain-containing protein [Actinomycetota bacterium]